jgi:hypothetical protein
MSDEFASAASVPDAPASASAPSEPDIRDTAASVFADQSSGDSASAPPADTPSTPVPSPDAATSVDGAAEAVEASTLARGPIPYDRHQAVVTNTRQKVRAEVEGEWKPKYERLSWAESVDAAKAQQAIALQTALESMADDPQTALAFLARKLGVTTDALAAPGPKVDADPAPEPDIPLEDGTQVYSATATRKLLEWQARQLSKQVDASYGPLKHKALLADLRVQAQQQTGQTLAECRKDWELFPALEAEIKQFLIADPSLSLERAYIRAFNGPNGWKKQQAATQQAAEEDRASQLTRKHAASDTLRPGAPRAVTPRSDAEKTPREIAAEVFATQ